MNESDGLRLTEVTVDLAGQRVLTQVSLAVAHGAMVGIIGPNGSGKSTLLRTVFRSLKPASGAITVDDDNLLSMPLRRAATVRSIVTQMQDAADDLTVAETVLTGALAGRTFLQRASAPDEQAVDDALARVDMSWARDRLLGNLSGGERQRVLIARAIAQRAPFIVLDEPTNHLDVGAALRILRLVRELGLGVLAALHDLDLAAAYCDQLVVVADGGIVTHGTPREVLTAHVLQSVFGVRGLVDENPLTGRPRVTLAPQDCAD
ncbi:ABC transporter ATP-binding protein [Williamsia sp. CHRR-6]|uniref:ABC transporter ATP-binding protein n=1 Tax=Williamsia sp. CHRR-6 TaxID=2835871 RepID=UPI001BDA9BAF|nr:ABC transporter ATP-binding protein [Williamsia sp. CHRR-6]MBT0567845.1 ABC transporter ATP-binding protein [Williamsia sp. CHRR-6]